jgi:predicted ATPase
LRRAAPAEAVAQLSAGLGLLAELPGDDERHREEIRLHLALGQALGLTKGRAAPEVGQAFGRACDLGRQVGHAPETGAALLGLYGYHLHRAGLNEARAAAGELLHLAEWQGDPVARAAAQGLGGSIAFFLGRLPEARSSLEAALADDALARSREFATHGVDPRQLGLAHLAWTVLVLGRPDEARRRGYEAIAEAEAPPRRPDALAAALFADGVVHQLVRDRPAVLARAERLAALAGEQDFPLWLAGAAVLQGWSLAEGGGPGGAMREMCHGLAAWRATGAEHLVPYFQALLADACAGRGGQRRGCAWWRTACHGRSGPGSGGARRNCSGSGVSCSYSAPAATGARRRRTCAEPARWPAGRARGRGSFGRR